MSRSHFLNLKHNESGATVTEFALILPALMVMLMGLLDLAYNMYTAQMLQGAIQQAARNSTIEGATGNSNALDGIVTTAVRSIVPGNTPVFSRKAYANFANVGRPEDFTDTDSDGLCNNNEPFEDTNGNGIWDQDPGNTGFGGARDAVLYTVTVTYRRPFPVFAFIPGQSSNYTMSASTVLRNQPFSQSAVPTIGSCT